VEFLDFFGKSLHHVSAIAILESLTEENNMELNFNAYKEAAKPVMRDVSLAGFETREQARNLIRKSLDAHQLDGTKRRFVADYVMSQLGFGGGF
jgi:hypothetical protein